ncbi:hypothetical protein [Microbacterium tumbae]
MSDLLHLCAVVPAALGAGALCGVKHGSGAPERLAAILMLLGMADAMTSTILTPVAWFAVMVPAGIGLAAWRRCMPSGTAGTGGRGSAAVSTHLALGLIVTAALILLMPTGSAPATAAASGHHGGISAMPAVLCAGLVLGSVAFTASALRTDRAWHHRLHHVAMAGSTVAMGAVVLS